MGENYYDAMARAEDEREAFAAKDAEIERLKADREHLITMLANTTNDLRAALARVTAQRDQMADALNGFDYEGHGKFLRKFGVVKVDGKWKEIES